MASIIRPLFGLLFLAVTSLVSPASSQLPAPAYPTRPITLLVPYPAGGLTDALARVLGERMKETLSQPIIIENVTGAGGTIAMSRLARSTPDGSVAGIGAWANFVASAVVYPVQFDVLADFEPAAFIATTAIALIGSGTLPAADLKSLIQWLKANPDKASVATVGLGSASHLSAIRFQNATGTRLRLVTYRGVPPAIQDIIGGHVDLMFSQATTELERIRNGQLRGYAVLAANRLPGAPEIPSIDEGGVSGLHMTLWHGLWMPRNTPPTIIATFERAAKDALADPGVRQKLAALGQEIPPPVEQSATALKAFHRAEMETWLPVIKAANIKPE